ncbi:MAG: CDP-diacylglycerol--glycerol-3-phosphate 3-phosphatidyltransferase [Gammaproteobacteria bacterium]|nr:CDP-diacylglycerol--glycerol-3-phosphate 3-phosphatidyltransferase [Gammaproteobacteria bacterium]
MSIPTFLTWLRVALIPVLVVCFYLPFSWANEVTCFVFVLAAITDWADGYLARKWDQTSRFGAFLDPVADKIMVAVALLLLVEFNPTPVFTIAAAIIIGREITISALREWMAEIGERAQVAVSTLGKVKTALQMAAISLLVYREPIFEFPVFEVGVVLLYVAAALTIWSMLLYLKAAIPAFKQAD